MKEVQTRARNEGKAILLRAAAGALLAGLCCLTPIVLVLLGLTTVTIANNWGNLLYGEYRWHFRLLALALLAATLVVYFRRRGVCTLDAARRQRNRIVNLCLLALLAFFSIYVFWTYVVLHYWGIAAGLPWGQWEESWAIPLSAVLLVVTALAFWLLPKFDAQDDSAAGPDSKAPRTPADS